MPELSVASFNTHAGMDGWGRPYDLIDACRQIDADVLVLQETFAPPTGTTQAAEIAERLGYTSLELPLAPVWRRAEPVWYGEGWQPRKVFPNGRKALRVGRHLDSARQQDLAGFEEGTWGLAVLSRFPVRESEVVELGCLKRDFTRRAALVAVLEVGGDGEGSPNAPAGEQFTVVGTHAAHLTHGSPVQLRRLYRRLPSGDRPAALAGDMNVWGPPIQLVLPGWKRAVRGRTWPAWRPHSQPDHVLVNAAVTVLGGSVVRAGDSDHRAVRARVRF